VTVPTRFDLRTGAEPAPMVAGRRARRRVGEEAAMSQGLDRSSGDGLFGASRAVPGAPRAVPGAPRAVLGASDPL
jgi:hypothetical protein